MTSTVLQRHAAADVPLARRGNVVTRIVGLVVCLLPFLSPAGPGNTAPADVAMIAAVLVGFVWLAREQLPMAFPYLWGMGTMIFAGGLAAALSGAPQISLLALFQDVLLLLWCTILTSGRHSPSLVAAVTRTWCWTATVYATVGVAAYMLGINRLSGVSERLGARATYTFGDANLAGNYLVVSLFVMLACKYPRQPVVRTVGYLALVVAIVFTGSNGALLTLVIGAAVAVTIGRFRAGVLPGLLALALSAVLATGLLFGVMTGANVQALRQQAAGSVPLLRDSVGRSGDSSSQRQELVSEGRRIFMRGDLMGYGPARTKEIFKRSQLGYVKEAHDDYLATLLERGVIGVVGLIVFGAAVLARCRRLLTCRLPRAYAALVPRPWVLVAIAPVMAVAATFYETLHFRHLWTWLGLVAALALVARDERQPR